VSFAIVVAFVFSKSKFHFGDKDAPLRVLMYMLYAASGIVSSNHTTKVRHSGCAAKFQHLNWGDFQHQFERFSAKGQNGGEGRLRLHNYATKNTDPTSLI